MGLAADIDSMSNRDLVIRGAREHNLKGFDLRIPRNTLTTITGVSGSGKSSLAFDTIYQEGQRRFMESLSAYARQFLGKMEKPLLDHIEGLSPTISIDQKTVNRNPRSTVGTVTEIYDHFRLLFARLGTPCCPDCGIPIAGQSADQITDGIFTAATDLQTMILAPIIKDRKGEYRKEIDELRMRGYVRARIDGAVVRLEEVEALDRYKNHSIEIIIDRILICDDKRSRLAEAVEQALREGDGVVYALVDGEEIPRIYSENFACPRCGFSVPELEPRIFSFNSPHGACPRCNGLGYRVTLDPSLLIRHPELSLRDGAAPLLEHWQRLSPLRQAFKAIEDRAKPLGFSLRDPWEKLNADQQAFVLFGDGKVDEVRVEDLAVASRRRHSKKRDAQKIGLASAIESVFGGLGLARYRRETTCDRCHGARLNPASLAVQFHSRSIGDFVKMSVRECDEFLVALRLSAKEAKIGAQLFKEIRSRLKFLDNVGLSYLTLDRRASTLSGGEAQRIRLATQLGANLRGVLYILDEPSIGLHPRDNRRLIRTLQALRDQGNTVFVVEHDLDTLFASDHVIDIGPGAGKKGGWVVAQGSLSDIAKSSRSVTGAYLRRDLAIAIPSPRRRATDRKLVIVGAAEHNLKKIDVEIPLGLLVAVTGVSGSGKSTLVNDILKRALSFLLHRAKRAPGLHDRIEGVGLVDKVIEIDQSPIGRTPRSNPATYTKVFDEIRKLFCQVPEARVRGYSPGRFSFNVEGGRCDECEGAGVNVVEMQFLPDVEVSCETCSGKRFNRETLDILYKGKTIFEVLELSVADAASFFSAMPRIKRTLDTMVEVGLGYVKLGQQATTLSGGEAQRVKLASELRRQDTGNTLYILDEPTTGLHLHDVARLIEALQALVDKGNTVLVIEHNLDVVKVVDYVIDLGPDGGDLGGYLVATGTPEELTKIRASYTGKVLRPVLKGEGMPKFDTSSRARSEKGKKSDSNRPIAGRELIIKGASKNNLKSIDVKIPIGKLTVVTGVSGSGKTSLVFDTIFSEGQRRFVECLSTYARRFLGRLDQPPVDRIDGLAPAIAIDQRSASHNPRSTVATSTEIYDYLRILYARIGISHCPECRDRLQKFSPTTAAEELLATADGERVLIAAPLVLPKSKRSFALEDGTKLKKLLPDLEKGGFVRLLIDGVVCRIEDVKSKAIKVRKRSSIYLVVDRMKIATKGRNRLVDSLELAFERGLGLATVIPVGTGTDELEGGRNFSRHPACPSCDHFSATELTPRMFSFNSHLGACVECGGLGFTPAVDEELLFDRPDLGVLGIDDEKGAQSIIGGHTLQGNLLKAAAVKARVNLAMPYCKLGPKALEVVLDGLPSVELNVEWHSSSGVKRRRSHWDGFRDLLLRWNRDYPDASFMARVRAVLKDDCCPACNGHRLRPELLAVTMGGVSIAEVCDLSVDEGIVHFERLELSPRESEVGRQAIQEVTARLRFLKKVGLTYLSLSRRTSSLSGGEAQRIRLATQIGSGLVGVIYVLDEPTIGLHQRDTRRLLETLAELRDLGNTVLVVEHDEESIRFADHVIDIGQGAGKRGGEVVAAGDLRAIMESANSLTGKYLRGDSRIEVPKRRREGSGVWLQVLGARANNLKEIDVSFPLSTLTAVTGVSGSGKSTLVMEILRKGLARKLRQGRKRPGDHDEIRGFDTIAKLVVIDQSPIGRTPASNAATYTGVFDLIRDVYAGVPLSKAKGFKKGRFSFNSHLGRCAVCSGRGFQLVDMQFLSDVWIECEICRGKRFNEETLRVEFKGKNIADVLEMEIKEALDFFERFPRIHRILQTLHDVGLGYLQLGQPAPTLSGGEAQRVKLSSELSRPHQGDTLYLLDEPTTGLHFADVQHLMEVLSRLVDAGNTVVVVEHNLDVIKACDWVIDLGPEGGDHGGEVLCVGPPEEIVRNPRSHTGKFLVDVLPKERKPKRRGAKKVVG